MMGEGEGDEDNGGDDDMEDGGNSESQPCQPLPPAVHDAYEKHIEFLKQTKGTSSHPRLYGSHQTFWLPPKNNYFII